jgi:Asp-tRNA(Asn)/Glu-tRNA(Gln) amidotransferase A subunit family amidase
MSVPGGFTREGLPVGIQLQGPHFHEERILTAGSCLERCLDLPPKELDI